jgi:TonB family protein
MRRRDISLTIALCASLTAHALFSRALADRYVATHKQIYFAGLPGETMAEDHIVRPAVRPPPLEFDLGSPDGVGNALDSSPGDQPIQAREGDQNQALGRLDPPGSNTPPKSATALEQLAAAEQMTATSAPPIAFGASAPSSELVGPAPKHRASSPMMAISSPPPAPNPAAAHEAAASASARPGEPAPQLESESDAFAKEGSVKFQRGKTDVQFGRKHKLVRPRFDLAVQQDVLTMRLPITLVLKLRLDGDGNVAAADVEKSSGSKLLDHAVKVTAFKWWFEPKKSKQSSTDEFLFTIRFL